MTPNFGPVQVRFAVKEGEAAAGTIERAVVNTSTIGMKSLANLFRFKTYYSSSI